MIPVDSPEAPAVDLDAIDPVPPKPGPDPGGPLSVTAPGSIVVATDEMLATAERLHLLDLDLAADARRAFSADAVPGGLPVPGLAATIDEVRAFCADAQDRIRQAAEAYTLGEAVASAVQHKIGALLAMILGPAALAGFLALLRNDPVGVIGAIVSARDALKNPESDPALVALRDFLHDNPELITSPEFTRFVSVVATSVDDLGVQVGFFPRVDDLFAPAGGVEAGAGAVVTAGATLGMFRETPVAIDRTSTTTGVTAASGVRERLDRIPEGDTQVRIERYDAPGQPPRYAVFIGPTESFSPFSNDETHDLTSAVRAVAGLDPASYRAVEAAMRDAGVSPADEVQVVGFSQGGQLATLLAGSGDWNVVGIESHGAPTGSVELPEGLAGMAVRNTDDFVPALGGPQLDHHLLQVEREAFAGGGPIPNDEIVPAHQRSAYERTADAIDGAESGVIRDQIRAMDAFAADYLDRPGGSVTVTTYRATRVSDDGSTIW